MSRVAVSPRSIVPLALLGLAAVLRVHNAWVAPPLSGFDGPYHGGYIAAIAWDGRFQLPHGFTNHPPLYYAVSAALWRALPDASSPHAVLFALRMLNVLLGLAAALAVAWSARLAWPERPRIALFALAIALLLPMHIGPAATLGNQIASTALGAGAVALLLGCLGRPDPRRAALAGLVAGLGVLTKLSIAIVVAIGSLALLARGLQLRGLRIQAFVLAAAFGLSALAATSPWLVAEAIHRGTPTDPRIDLWSGMDRNHQLPPRPWSAYVDPDPTRLRDPGHLGDAGQQAVWPVTFASTWFDLFGTVVDVHHRNARRLAHVLFGLGAVFSLATVLGVATALRGRAPCSIPLAIPTLAGLVALTLASYVAFTREVATYGALKGTYLSPALTGLVAFTALGLDRIASLGRVTGYAVAALIAGLAVAVTTLYWQGGVAPMRVNPADLVLRDYADPPSLRAFRYFAGRPPGTGPPPPLERD